MLKVQVLGLTGAVVRFLMRILLLFCWQVGVPGDEKLLLIRQEELAFTLSQPGKVTPTMAVLRRLSSIVTTKVQEVGSLTVYDAGVTVTAQGLGEAEREADPSIFRPLNWLQTPRVKGVAGRLLGGAVYLPRVILQTVPANRVGLEEDWRMRRVLVAGVYVTAEEKIDRLMVETAIKRKLVPVGNTSWKQSVLARVSGRVKAMIREVPLLTQKGELEAERDRLRTWGERPETVVVQVSICSPVEAMECRLRVSGAVVVGGEKRGLTQKEKGDVIYVPLMLVMVQEMEAVDTVPVQEPAAMFPERTEQVRADPRGSVWEVEMSSAHWRVEGKLICILSLVRILLVGLIHTTIAPVVLTWAGVKVTLQAEKGAAVRVTAELWLLTDTSVPISMMKGLVVTAGQGFRTLVTVTVMLAMAEAAVTAPSMLTLLAVTD